VQQHNQRVVGQYVRFSMSSCYIRGPSADETQCHVNCLLFTVLRHGLPIST